MNRVAALDSGNRIAVALQNKVIMNNSLAAAPVAAQPHLAAEGIISFCACSSHLARTPTTAAAKAAGRCLFVTLVVTAAMSISHHRYVHEVLSNATPQHTTCSYCLQQLLPSHAQAVVQAPRQLFSSNGKLRTGSII